MAGREVTLCLKYPGPSYALQRLHQSFLECVVEYKTGNDFELQTRLPAELSTKFQLKGTVTVTDDEIIIQFTPKYSGVHTARLFSDTREICRPVPFLVSQRGETINLPPDRPVQKPPAAPESHSTPSRLPVPPFYGLNNPRLPPAHSPQSVLSDATTAAQTEPHPGHDVEDGIPEQMRTFTSDPALAMHAQGPGQRLSLSPQRGSYISRATDGARPLSRNVEEAGVYRVDVTSPRQQETHFGDLYATKKAGGKVYGNRRGPLSIDYQSVVTAETLRMLSREADAQMKVFRGGKAKRRCDICSKKVKTTKSVSVSDEDYCDSCFRRQYLLCSAIDHFMVPSIQECNIQVPINKRATKFVTTRKTIANVNLRGLEPTDVRYAQEEFHKFDMENNGWIQKAVLMPVLKACLSLSGVRGRESKVLLNSQALQSTISSYGLDDREEVHEIEFLSLLAFIARERERLRTTAKPRTRGFTRNDLEMAYAFRQQMSGAKQEEGRHSNKRSSGEHDNQQAGLLGMQQQITSNRQPYEQRSSYYIPKSQTEGTFTEKRNTMLSPPTSRLIAASEMDVRETQPMYLGAQPPLFVGAVAQPVIPQGPFLSPPGTHQDHVMQSYPQQRRQSVTVDDHVPLGDRLAARRAAAKRLSVVSRGDPKSPPELYPGGEPMTDLPEEDRDDEEVPMLPPGKDPSVHQTNSIIGRTPTNNKRLMEEVNKELKLTGGKADGWMLY